MALTLPKCRSILAQIEEKYHIYHIVGLESLATLGDPDREIGPMGAEFRVSLYKKSNDPIPDEPAVIIYGAAGPGQDVYGEDELYVAYLKREPEQGAAKGAGKLLLELVACRAAELGIKLTLVASSEQRRQRHAEKLYRFYNSAGMQRKGPEVVVNMPNGSFLTRHQNYSTSPETLRAKYVGGKRRHLGTHSASQNSRRRTRKYRKYK